MKKRYKIVRIVDIVSQIKEDDLIITKDCYTIVDKGYKTAESAYKVKEKYTEPSHYIIVGYWC